MNEIETLAMDVLDNWNDEWHGEKNMTFSELKSRLVQRLRDTKGIESDTTIAEAIEYLDGTYEHDSIPM